MNKKELKEFYKKQIMSGRLNEIKVFGSSMLPTIASGQTVEVELPEEIEIDDIVVVQSDNHFVVHRIKSFDKKNNKVCLLGDNQSPQDMEWYDLDSVVAKVKKVVFDTTIFAGQNVVISLPYDKPKTFNTKSFEIFQSILDYNKNTTFVDYNIEFNRYIFGEDFAKKFCSQREKQEIENSCSKMDISRKLWQNKYGLYRFTYSALRLCDSTSETEILNTINNYKDTIYYEFFSKMIDKSNFACLENLNLFLPVDNFDKLLSAIIFSKVLFEKFQILPILVNCSTLFELNFNTKPFEIYFKQVINNNTICKNITTSSCSYDAIDFDRYICQFKTAQVRFMHECYYKRCLFCDRHSKHNFFYPVENIFKKISNLYNLGIDKIVFVDDCLILSNIVSLLEKLKESNIKINWTGIFRFDKQLNDDKIIKYLAENGCKILFFGLESFDQEYLNLINKGIEVDVAKNILKMCHKYGIKTSVSFLFNFPGETKENLNLTLKGIEENIEYIDYFEFNFFQPTQNCKLNLNTNGINYHLKPDIIDAEKMEIIRKIMSIAKDNNKTDSYYLKNVKIWES